MKLPNDWNEIQPADDAKAKLPPDAYVCKIHVAEIENDRLRLKLDIDDGEFKNYFSDDYESRLKNTNNSTLPFWRLNYSVPVDFNDVNRGYFYKRIFKRFVNTLEGCNQNFNLPPSFEPSIFNDKRLVALIDVKEKQGDNRIYQNYYVRREYTLKQLANGEVPPAEITDVNGVKRKAGDPPPPPSDHLEPVDDVDIPF